MVRYQSKWKRSSVFSFIDQIQEPCSLFGIVLEWRFLSGKETHEAKVNRYDVFEN
jgi:hypothetical protein